MRALVNAAPARETVPPPSAAAPAFHACLDGYHPTPLRELPALAAELGLGAVGLKDESSRLGLPAFKILGASWAVEQAMRARPDTTALVAASAGNHGRAVAHEAARRGLACRVMLPARSAPARRAAIAGEGAEVVVIDGDYEQAVVLAEAEGRRPGVALIADVGAGDGAADVIDGYATLFAEAAVQGTFDLVLVPVGVGSLAAAAVRFAVRSGARVVAVEPDRAACLARSLAAGRPVTIPTPGTAMAGMDCAEVSAAAWPVLRAGVDGVVTISDEEARAAMRELAGTGLRIGDCGAAPLAALRALATDPDCAALRDAIGLGRDTEALLIATEGVTDPEGYARAIGAA